MGVWVHPLNFRGCDQKETLPGTLPVPTVTREAGFSSLWSLPCEVPPTWELVYPLLISLSLL